MVSGNTCQEYAVDIAFQLSSSRTYTFVKIMALPRMRNIVFFIALALSTAFVVFGHPYARVLNPLFLTNLFAAWELSRIGIHNQAQEVDLRYISSVFRAYFIYPRRGDFFLLLFICGCLVYLYQQLDGREFVVISSLLFAVVLVLLRRTLWWNFQKIDMCDIVVKGNGKRTLTICRTGYMQNLCSMYFITTFDYVEAIYCPRCSMWWLCHMLHYIA